MKWTMVWIALILSASSAQATVLSAPKQNMDAQISVHFKDAGHLNQFLNKNQKAKKFLGSNLYRGLFYRLHPVFGLLSSEYSATWEGRLLDYVYKKTMEGRPLTLAYFPQRNLNSPFGTSIANLTATEEKLITGVLSPFSQNKYQVPLTPQGTAKTSVHSVQIQSQKFAQSMNNGCLGLSRDPYVAGKLSSGCQTIEADAVVDANILLLLPSLSGIYTRFFSRSGNLRLNLSWNSTQSQWTPSSVHLPVLANHQFKKGAIPSGMFSAIPASTALFLTAQIPDPGGFDPQSMKTYLQEPPTTRNQRDPLTLGLVAFWLDGKLETAVLIGKEAQPEDMEGFRQLYNNSSLYDVHFARICKQFVGVSTSSAAIEQMSKACAGSVPNLLHLSQTAVQKIHGQNPSAVAVVNFGKLLDETYKVGLTTLKENNDSKPEVKEAQQILSQLPYYFFAGDVTDDTLTMKEVH